MLKFISENDRTVRNHSERDRIVRNHSGFLCPVHQRKIRTPTSIHPIPSHPIHPPIQAKNTALYPLGRFSPSRPSQTAKTMKIICPVLAGRCAPLKLRNLQNYCLCLHHHTFIHSKNPFCTRCV